MTKFDIQTALAFFQDARFLGRQYSGEEVSTVLTQISSTDLAVFARRLITSSQGDSDTSTIIFSLSEYLLGTYNFSFVVCERGYMLLKSLFEQLKFCKRYGVLLKISEDVAVNAASHLEKLRSTFESKVEKYDDVAEKDDRFCDSIIDNSCLISNEGKLLLLSISKLLRTVLGGLQHSPRGFLRCLEFLLAFLEFVDTESTEVAYLIVEIINFCKYIHSDVIELMDDVNGMIASSSVLQRHGNKPSIEFQDSARKCAWTNYTLECDNSNLPGSISNGPVSTASLEHGIETINKSINESRSHSSPPPWPRGSFEMETTVNLEIKSVCSCRAAKLKAASLLKIHGKPCHFEGDLIECIDDDENFPYQLFGNVKLHRKKEESPSSGTTAVTTTYEPWSCPACTFLNDGDAKNCKTCNTPAPPKTKLSKQGENPGVVCLKLHKSGNSFGGFYGRGSEEKIWLGKRIVYADGDLKLSSCMTMKDCGGESGGFCFIDFGQYYHRLSSCNLGQSSVGDLWLGIDARRSFSFDRKESFSIELCFSIAMPRDESASSCQTLLSNNQYGLWLNAEGILCAWYDNISCTYTPSMEANQFYHAVLNWDSNSNSLRLYFDGKLLQPNTCDAPVSTSTVSRLLFGARYYGEKIADVFSGKLFDIKIYAHTDDFGIDELISNYEKRAIVEKDNPSLKGHWPLINDGDDVSFLADKSRGCNHASVVYNEQTNCEGDAQHALSKARSNAMKHLFAPMKMLEEDIIQMNGQFVKRRGNFVFAGAQKWHSKQDIHVLGSCDGEVNGSVWCGDKVHLCKPASIFIKNVQQNNDAASKFRIVLQACSWWEIDATKSRNLRSLSKDRNARIKKETPIVEDKIPPAPQAINANQSSPSDESIAQFLALTGSDSKDVAIFFLNAANLSFEQAVSLFFDPVQRSRILLEMQSMPQITPSPAVHKENSDFATTNKEDLKVKSPKIYSSDSMLPGLYVDVSIQTFNNVSTYSVTVQVVDKNGEMQLCSKADNILKCENNLQLVMDFQRDDLHFLQYNDDNGGSMPTARKASILTLKAMNVFHHFDDAWFGLIGSNLCFSDLLIDCSKPSKEHYAAAKYFNDDFNTLEQYFSKKSDDENSERKDNTASKIPVAFSANPNEPDENTKNFMEVTGVSDVSIAARWIKGNNNNAQTAILSYFQDPTKVPPVTIIPTELPLTLGSSGNEAKAGFPNASNNASVETNSDVPGKRKTSVDTSLLKIRALRRVIDGKYNDCKSLNDPDFVKRTMEEVSLWDTTYGIFATKVDTNKHLVNVLTGITKKETHKIYGYASLSENIRELKDKDAKRLEWIVQGFWIDMQASSRVKNLVLIRLDFDADKLNGMLFKGNSITEWRGKRIMNFETFRNSFQNSTGCCGLMNGKEDLTNICFQNSLLQSLYRSSDFRSKVIQMKGLLEDVEDNSVIRALADLYAALSGIDKPYIASHQLQKALPSGTFGSGQQQDVSEFWQYISSEFGKVGVLKKDYDITRDLFGCTIRNSMQCCKCGNLKSGKDELYLDIPLVFPTRFKAITDIKVVSGKGLEIEIPDGYERFGLNLNEGREDTPYVFLCLRRDTDKAIPPISDITIVDCGPTDPRPDLRGWEFVDGNLNQGGLSNAKRIYLAFKRGEGSPISNIDVVIGKDSHVKEGFVKINKDINGGEKEPLFLCYKQDLPIRDIVVRNSGVKGYTFVDVNISPNDAQQLYVCHTDQGEKEPITGIHLVDQSSFETMTDDEKNSLQVLSKSFGNSEKTQYLVATRGNGCPITEIHVFRAPQIRPKHGYPEFVDLIKSNKVWPHSLTGTWLSTKTSPRVPRERARKKLPLSLNRRVEDLVKIRGSYSGFGGGEINGILIPMNPDSNGNTEIYSSMCTLKGGEFKSGQHISVSTRDNFRSIEINGTIFIQPPKDSVAGSSLSQGNSNIIQNPPAVAQNVSVTAVRSNRPLVIKSFITDVAVASSSENVPPGFEIIDKCCNDTLTRANLNRDCATTKEVFICVKRDPNKLPLVDIGVVWGFEMPANVGYEVITSTTTTQDCNLNQGLEVPALYICTRRATEGQDIAKGLMDLAVIRIGGVSSAKPPKAFERIEKSQGTMRHDADLNSGNLNKHRLYLCKRIDHAEEKPIEHVINSTYESNELGVIELYGTFKTFGHSIKGSFDPKIDPSAQMRGEAPQYQGVVQGIIIPTSIEACSDAALVSQAKAQADWNFIGRWKDSTTQHLLPCSLTFQYPYLECKGKYSDGKEEYDWSFVKDDFIQMSFKKDYNCSFRNRRMEFGERCFRHDISNMVLNFFAPSVNPEIDCDTCQVRTAHTNRVHCTRSPEHLMLTVKRMSFDWRRNKNVKSLMDAHFSSTVNLPQYSDSASSEKETPKDSKCRSYGLFAIIVHSGKTANSGHYYAFARSADSAYLHKQDAQDAPWIKFNDMRVKYVEGGFKGMRENISKSVGANAYILIYKRLQDSKLAEQSSALPGELIQKSQIGLDSSGVKESDRESDDEAALLSMALQISKNNSNRAEDDAIPYDGDVVLLDEEVNNGIDLSDDQALEMALALSKSSVVADEDDSMKKAVTEEKRDGMVATESIDSKVVESVKDTKFASGKDLTKLLPTWYAAVEAENVRAIEKISKLEATFIDLVRSMGMENHEAVSQPTIETQAV